MVSLAQILLLLILHGLQLVLAGHKVASKCPARCYGMFALPDPSLTRTRLQVSGHGTHGGKGRCYPFWQSFQACMAGSNPGTGCKLQAEDYKECLHHSKKVRAPHLLAQTMHFVLSDTLFWQSSYRALFSCSQNIADVGLAQSCSTSLQHSRMAHDGFQTSVMGRPRRPADVCFFFWFPLFPPCASSAIGSTCDK